MAVPKRPLGLDVAAGNKRRVLSGAVPLGFRMGEDGGILPDPEGLETVRLILRRRRAGASFRAVAAELTEKGHKTKRGGAWFASTVRYIWEHRERYVGVVEGAVELRLIR